MDDFVARFNERRAEESRAVCERIEREDAGGRVALTDRERQILDMWPRFEDGEYVWFEDRYIDGNGGEAGAVTVAFMRDAGALVDRYGLHTCYGQERVKRPAPKDSWERLEEDAGMYVCDYARGGVAVGGGHLCEGCPYDVVDRDGMGCKQRMARDLVRRAKALAGVAE